MKDRFNRTIIVALLLFYGFAGFGYSSDLSAGWRNDATGRFPQADIPTTWSEQDNIVWKTKMPGYSNSSPIIVDGKLFVCAEPSTLICLNPGDGEILWQKTNHYFDTLTEDEAAKSRKILEQSNALEKELEDAEQQLKDLKKELAAAPNNPEISSKIESLDSKVDNLEAEIEKLSAYKLPDSHEVNNYSTPTPTTDGNYIYVLFGNGVASCYDLAGNRKWTKFVEEPKDKHGWGHSSSPLLVGDKLMIHITDLWALDTSTGKDSWKVETSARWGTPIKAAIDSEDVVITAGGLVVKASDGHVLADEISSLEYASPIISGSNLYFIESESVAFQLPSEISGDVKFKEIWKTEIHEDRYYASSVLHENLIYAVTLENILSVVDASNGTLIYEKELELGRGTVYPSIVLAGDKLLISSDNGTTIVLKHGREYEELAKNSIEGFRSCPLVVDNKMYIRSFDHLYCIGEK
ncbi:MAG: outer membrane protein assembly factor BamB family protein [Planctomycetota bacterium]|jgi:outer membrane protein assembly factor BamB